MVRKRWQQAEATKHKTDFVAIAAFEVRRVAYTIDVQNRMNPDWPKIDAWLMSLIPLARDFGHEVRSEAVYAASLAADMARFRMPPRVASTLNSLLTEILPISAGLNHPVRRKLTDEDRRLISNVIEAAFSMCYDGCTIRKLEVVEAGALTLHLALRFASVNRLVEIEQEILTDFQQSVSACDRKIDGKAFPEGKQILMDLRAEALSAPQAPRSA